MDSLLQKGWEKIWYESKWNGLRKRTETSLTWNKKKGDIRGGILVYTPYLFLMKSSRQSKWFRLGHQQSMSEPIFRSPKNCIAPEFKVFNIHPGSISWSRRNQWHEWYEFTRSGFMGGQDQMDGCKGVMPSQSQFYFSEIKKNLP